MNLYLVRHAVARDGEDDDARPLTPKGARRFAQAVEGLDALGVSVERVLHSPKLRAVETAELLEPVLDGHTEVTPLLARTPDAELLALLAGADAAAVGHEPWLGALCAWLVTGDPARGAAFPFKKGGVARLEGEPRPGAMRLLWLATPRMLRGTGR